MGLPAVSILFLILIPTARGAPSNKTPSRRSMRMPKIETNDTISSYLAQYGIAVEEHFATTDDGYILRLFRLARPGASVMLLQHGILASSWVWLVNRPEQSLGMVLWNMGYDVWLSNSRGNTFSRNHTTLEPSTRKFWNFTFGDMRLDVVANIRHVINTTLRDTLTYVGWSQGTTQMFIAATGSEKRFVEQHVNLFVALSPVAYLGHCSSLLLNVMAAFRVGTIMEELYPYGFLTQQSLPKLASLLCRITHGKLCSIGVDTVCGVSKLDDPSAITNMAAHFPAGCSVKDTNHFQQLTNSKRFARFDYGKAGNLAQYGQVTPPEYPLTSLELPTALFMGSSDDLAGPRDTDELINHLKGNPSLVFQKRYNDYSHVTWLVGDTWDWFDDLQTLLRRYNPLWTPLVI